MAENYENNIAPAEQKYTTEQEVRQIIASALANYSGVVKFRTIVSTTLSIADFTSSQHNHSNTTNGGQINPNTAFTTVVTVPNGGTGVNTLTGIAKGNGAGAFTAIVPLASTKIYYVSDTSGGAVTRKLTFVDGILTAET